MNSILEQFRLRGFESGGEVYVTLPDGYEFIAALLEAEYAISGVEAVRRQGDRIYPLIDQIADFSSLVGNDWSSRVETSNNAAVAFLGQLPRDDEIMVTFTFEAHSEKRN